MGKRSAGASSAKASMTDARPTQHDGWRQAECANLSLLQPLLAAPAFGASVARSAFAAELALSHIIPRLESREKGPSLRQNVCEMCMAHEAGGAARSSGDEVGEIVKRGNWQARDGARRCERAVRRGKRLVGRILAQAMLVYSACLAGSPTSASSRSCWGLCPALMFSVWMAEVAAGSAAALVRVAGARRK